MRQITLGPLLRSFAMLKAKMTLPVLTLVVGALVATGCNKSVPDHVDGHAHQYTCPMKEHSDVLSDKPGNCPKCGMKLVEKQ